MSEITTSRTPEEELQLDAANELEKRTGKATVVPFAAPKPSAPIPVMGGSAFPAALPVIPKSPELPQAHGNEYEKWKSLGRVELRSALIDAGVDMDQRIISDAKMLGPGAISRRDAIRILTAKGITPPE